MSDEKPKGLDLSKLLKKKAAEPDASEKPAEAQPLSALASPVEPAAAPAPPPKKGLDLGKLLKKNAPEPEPASPPPVAPTVVEEAPPPVAPPPPVTAQAPLTNASQKPSTPTKPATPPPAIAKPATPKPPPPAVAKPATPPPTTPPKSVIEPIKQAPAPINIAQTAGVTGVVADQGTTPFSSSVEDVASREGAKKLKLDLTVAETRKFPLGFFGANELHMHVDEEMETLARHIYRLRDHKDGFSIAYRITGAVFMNFGVIWDGKQLTDMIGTLPPNPTCTITRDADAVIDLVRGNQTCATFRHQRSVEGDETLLYWLAVDIYAGWSQSLMEIKIAQDDARKAERAKLLKESKDTIDLVLGLCEMMVREKAKSIVEPLFLRLFFPGKVEALLHFEAQKVTLMRGKAGESLVQGALELTFDDVAMNALKEGECGLYFLLLARHILCTGDLNVFVECGLIPNPLAVGFIRHVTKTGAVISPTNRLPKTIKVVGPAKDPYLTAI